MGLAGASGCNQRGAVTAGQIVFLVGALVAGALVGAWLYEQRKLRKGTNSRRRY